MKFIFLLFITLITCTSCNEISIIDDNIAEIREFLYEGQIDDMSVSLVCGKREKDYIINGYVTELIEFGVLTFDMKSLEDNGQNLGKYVLFVGNDRYDGDLQKNPFDGTLVADVKKNINTNSTIRAKIILGDYEKEVKLKRIDDKWSVRSEDVKKIISSNFKEDINSLTHKKVFEGEIYIKIMNDADMYSNDYYWYVSIVSRKGGKVNAIISNKSGEILSINNTLNKM